MAALPSIPGPKLLPFDTKGQPLHIEFLGELGKGLHSVVWKVRINEALYALKIESMDLGNIDVSNNDRDCYIQPFENECHAFARLKETGNAHLAARYYGYLYLNEDGVSFLKAQCGWGYIFQEQENDKPVRAVVKELIEPPPDGASHREWVSARINYRSAAAVIRNLKTVHKLGILVRDVHEDNFMYNKWMGFSRALTAPHPLLDQKSSLYKETIDEFAIDDAVSIDDLIDTYNERHPEKKIWVRMFSSPEYTGNLRSINDRDRHRLRVYWKFGCQKFHGN